MQGLRSYASFSQCPRFELEGDRLFDSVVFEIDEVTEALGALQVTYVRACLGEYAETLGLNPDIPLDGLRSQSSHTISLPLWP